VRRPSALGDQAVGHLGPRAEPHAQVTHARGGRIAHVDRTPVDAGSGADRRRQGGEVGRPHVQRIELLRRWIGQAEIREAIDADRPHLVAGLDPLEHRDVPLEHQRFRGQADLRVGHGLVRTRDAGQVDHPPDIGRIHPVRGDRLHLEAPRWAKRASFASR
jgi:hypothetical protein